MVDGTGGRLEVHEVRPWRAVRDGQTLAQSENAI